MKPKIEAASQWCYQGIWGVLTRYFRVPDQPPTLPPTAEDEQIQSFKPAYGFLNYLRLQFWVACILIDLGILIGWVIILVNSPWIGVALALPALFLAVVPDVIAYIAIHLRFDTTWYVVSDRSLRIRRGIWVIHETTITFDNVQNVSISQGPLQRYFGIADVLVETAGGGDKRAQQQAGHAMGAHLGLIQGIANATEIRSQLMARVGESLTSGLGDEDDLGRTRHSGWTDEQVTVLREIRDLVVAAGGLRDGTGSRQQP